MKDRNDDIAPGEFREWIAAALEAQTHRLSQGYQGHTYLYEKAGKRWVVKAPMGWGPARWIRRWMLQNEYRVYRKLGHADGVPKCYGFIDGRYLILEHIDGLPIRNASIDHPADFYRELFERIRQLHAKGVAHGDLKKKDNILVVANRHPFLIDFGVAVVRKSGWAPLNHYLYSLLKRFDYNAWIKHKYNRDVQGVCEADRCYYERTGIEYLAGWIKRGYRKAKGWVLLLMSPPEK